MSWENKTNKRFVAFFDILGFKDMVMKYSHQDVLSKLNLLKKHTLKLENFQWNTEKTKKANINPKPDQTKSVTFSDSIIFFSHSGTKEDFVKILVDSHTILKVALNNGIAIKGAISFGEITVDFVNSLFFGQPIIDAYLLHEDLHMLDVVLDHNCENQIKTFGNLEVINLNIRFDKVKMKYGSVKHTIVVSHATHEERIKVLEELYRITSGKPRMYIDNSLEYYRKVEQSILEEIKSLKEDK